MNKRILIPVITGLVFLAACGNEKEKTKKNDSVAPADVNISTSSGNVPPPTSIKFEGDTIVRYPSGLIQMKGYMGGGMRQGQWVAFFKDGTVQSECQYRNNMKHGRSTVYRENGKKYWDGFYNLDKKVGKWKFWDDAGHLTEKDYGGTMPGVK